MSVRQRMRKLFFVLLFGIVVIFGVAACPTNHELRVRNNSSATRSVAVGSLSFNNCQPAHTTGYQEIEEGTHTISGDYSGSLSITGKGDHKWTMTLKADGTIGIDED